MAILTIWSDKRVEEAEERFLNELCVYLGFSLDDMENSIMAIEGFVLEHWDQISLLQNKKDFNEVSERFITRLSKVATNNSKRLIKEAQDSNDLMLLLQKAKSNELSEEEKKKLLDLLISVLKTIPTFVIISLPQKFLTLPILMKILPKNFFAETLAI
jgi:hypothetical protein